MLSSWTAMIWKSTGVISAVVPSIFAWIVLVSIPLATYSAFTMQGQKLSAIVCLFILALDPKIAEIASWLAADTLLALVYLLSFILLIINRSKENTLTLLLGFVVACSGWVKNEGLLFITVFSLFFLLKNIREPKVILRYIVGMLLPLMMIFFFKQHFAPANDIMAGQGAATSEKLKDFSRYSFTFIFFLKELWLHYKMIIFLMIAMLVFKRSYFRSFYFGVILLVLGGYFMTYIITPNDLQWHLETSLERLFHQIYPSILFTSAWYLGRDEIRV
jgi:hypothetical protein